MMQWSIISVTTATVHDDSYSRFRGFSSDRYVLQDRAHPEHVVPLVIGLYPGDFKALERAFYDVSNPTHAQYGQYLAQKHIDHLSRPLDGALEAVRAWVANVSHENSTGTFSVTSNLFKIPIKVKHIERLLETELYSYKAKEVESGVSSLRQRRLMRASTAVSVPDHLKDVVSFLSVNTHPLGLRALGATSSQVTDTNNSQVDTLALIRQTYGIPHDLVVTNPGNTQCVPSFYNESYNPDDLHAFFTQFLPGESPPQIIQKGDRVNRPEEASMEATLDLQFITGVGRNATTFVWTMNGSNPYSVEDEPFVEFAEDVLTLANPPLVVSISYSDDEEHIFNVSAGYARTLDTLLIKMGLRGMTVLVAGGDDGARGLRPEFEKVPVEDICKQSGPQWPSSSPYITTVGATMLLTSAQQSIKPFFRTKEEVVCSVEYGGVITSGSGFSSIYPTPEYQLTAVKRYLTTRNIPTTPGFFNASGRAYPDVSALGANFYIHMRGRLSSVSGTSASTPVIGAMVTLWNDVRLNAGKSPLGFINPLLYYLAETQSDAFHDVVVGNNGAAGSVSNSCEDSFSASAGWDAISGVGTPNFPVISMFIQTLEDHFNVSQLGKSNTSSMVDVSNDSVTSTFGIGKMSTFTMVLLVAAVMSNIVIGIVVVVALVKRWRNQYTPLDDAVCENTALPASVSTTSSTSRTQQLDLGTEDDVKLSEVNLN
ncbi:unnamed protein product [Peronospora belbahrii]|uniref:subtilisin n=1 Tax=Peronospora belbahrii TaxID=622444 RepID=A0ABN8D0U0_9STRA|nr:unnamed protein product [Peronospora belbahrii]